jgi:cytidyltransferase-like protein
MIALTIGVFDGVHRGHQLLLRQMKKRGHRSVIVTFSNHPAEILKNIAPPLLTPLPLKCALLKECGADEVVVIPFTKELAEETFEDFLAPYPIQHLVLGEDAAFGKGCLGRPDALRLLGLQRGFSVHALPKLHFHQKPITSTRIRVLIAQGNLQEAEALLGRSHCFYYSSPALTAALPPDGEYPVWAHSSAGVVSTTLSIRGRLPQISLESPQLISFGKNINPLLFSNLCQTSPAAS